MKKFAFGGAALAVTLSCQPALAQFAAGAHVYAAPAGPSDWYSGCTVVDGPNDNHFYRVTCAGTTYWINAERVSTNAPQPYADPMRPGNMVRPTITPSDPPKTAARQADAPARTAAAPAAKTQAMGTGSYGRDVGAPMTGNYAGAMAANIANDKRDAAAVNVLTPGKYTCYASGQYTFTDLIIKSPTLYADSNGNSGSYSIARGALSFTSGPYKGAYSRMVDGHTIGLSNPGNTNLGTQCGLEK